MIFEFKCTFPHCGCTARCPKWHEENLITHDMVLVMAQTKLGIFPDPDRIVEYAKRMDLIENDDTLTWRKP